MKGILRDLTPLLLLVSWPFVAFIATNRTQALRLSDILVPWAVVIMLAVLVTVLATRFLPERPLRRVSITVSFLGIVFFSFGSLTDLFVLAGIRLGTVWLTIWLVVFVITGTAAWALSRRPAAYMVTNVVALTLIALPAVQIATDGVATAELRFEDPIDGNAERLHSDDGRPNVYWFLLDGYVRDDTLAKYFAHDNQPFLSFLTNNGFRIGKKSFSNYDNTTLSLTSTLTNTYQRTPDGPGPHPDTVVSILSGFNPAVQKFISLGYQYIHAPYAGAAKTQCGGLEEKCIRAQPTGSIPLNEVQAGLLQLTPLFRIIRKAVPDAFRYDHIFVEDVMTAIDPSRSQPFFLFAHILSPHAPPRYSANCQRINDVGGIIDVGEGQYDPEQFRLDTLCTSRSVKRAVQSILANDQSDPIIILQGDHGFKFRLPGEPEVNPARSTKGEGPFRRLAILNAIRLPKSCREFFRPALSPINTFPLVFACLEGRPPKLYPNRHFIRPNGSAGGVVEVQPYTSR